MFEVISKRPVLDGTHQRLQQVLVDLQNRPARLTQSVNVMKASGDFRTLHEQGIGFQDIRGIQDLPKSAIHDPSFTAATKLLFASRIDGDWCRIRQQSDSFSAEGKDYYRSLLGQEGKITEELIYMASWRIQDAWINRFLEGKAPPSPFMWRGLVDIPYYGDSSYPRVFLCDESQNLMVRGALFFSSCAALAGCVPEVRSDSVAAKIGYATMARDILAEIRVRGFDRNFTVIFPENLLLHGVGLFLKSHGIKALSFSPVEQLELNKLCQRTYQDNPPINKNEASSLLNFLEKNGAPRRVPIVLINTGI